jgi:predicted ATPase/class 3 adenylate cyclase
VNGKVRTDNGERAAPGKQAAALPTGTVTFLFTDVEGSTQLWERHHDAMRSALADHDALLRAAVEAHRGLVFKTVGDAVCAAFLRPEDALAAALEAQRGLSGHPWPEPIERLRVRMAIHTGSAVETEGDYFGPTVNRVARLMSIGHGEQILVSSTSALLLRDVLPAQTSLRDLGSHRLKDLSHPEIAYQVVADGLRDDFPALRSLDAQSNGAVPDHNLPLPLTSFYGRDGELAALTRELEDHRLVTLTGFGGVGKTRLALEAGWSFLDQFPDGVHIVELAPLSDPNLVAPRIATALGLPEQSGQLPGNLWVDALRAKRALLIVDNCEHVLHAVGDVVERLLQRCPDFRVLATSREPLHVRGERVVRLSPLALAAAGAGSGATRNAPAVSLFLDRISDTAPEFTIADDDAESWRAVANVCSKLDGIPLALELAAARVSTLGLQTLERGLENRFRVLRGGSRTSLPRQQTLLATLEWSYTVLDEREQSVFNRLGVFAGTFASDAVAAVCSDEQIDPDDVLDILSSLVDKSLVVAAGARPATRYRLLETTRAYALQRLTTDAAATAARRRQAEHFHGLSLRLNATFGSGPLADWFATYSQDVDNFRAALTWTIDEGGDALLGAGILWNLRRLVEWLNLNAEGLTWCQKALSALGSAAPPLVEANIQIIATRMHAGLGAFHAAIPTSKRAVELYRAVGAEVPLACALAFYGRAQASVPDMRETADRALDESLAIFARTENRPGSADDPEGGPVVRALFTAFATAYKSYTIDPTDFPRRRAYLAEAVERYRAISPGHFIIGTMLVNLSELELEAAQYERAIELARQGLAFYHGSGTLSGYMGALNAAGTAALALGDVAAARADAGELLTQARRLGSAPGLGMTLLLLAAIEAMSGDGTRAAGLLGAWSSCGGKIDTPQATTRFLCDRANELLGTALGDAALATAVADGSRWTIDEAIEIAQVVLEAR